MWRPLPKKVREGRIQCLELGMFYLTPRVSMVMRTRLSPPNLSLCFLSPRNSSGDRPREGSNSLFLLFALFIVPSCCFFLFFSSILDILSISDPRAKSTRNIIRCLLCECIVDSGGGRDSKQRSCGIGRSDAVIP